ncbi:sulfatase [Alienimonas chondri]|uniref:Arylsulfatase n=1 Tax=Alienimonas chondri TaxID=2681879 RepID=A0ABX1VHT4_9PLAN|nr:sulfatase [Alienimonas chondri]NNJ26807.1 Arylsulfatase [Alienimonas chondri]
MLRLSLALVPMLFVVGNAAGASPRGDGEAGPPNVVLFLVDDLGANDLGCTGSTFYETPNIDALAASGTRFAQAYAACPVCSPTRASIMTGRHPVRVDITDWIPGARRKGRFQHVDDRNELALEEVTLAETLKEEGYGTFFAGKWHLGDEGHWPTEQGFDFNIGGNHKGSPPGGYYAPWTNPTLTARADGEYLTDRLSDETAAYVQNATGGEQGEAGKPFFAMLSFYNVHTPITADEQTVAGFEEAATRLEGETPVILEDGGGNEAASRGRQDLPAYASMVAAVDRAVGKVLNTLENQGVRDNTVVIFFSDNGGLCTLPRGRNGQTRIGPTSNLPLRSGKGWLYEGGVREPLIIAGPGVQAGQISQQVAFSTDLFPTVLDLCGLKARPELHVDGVSLAPVLNGSGDLEPRDLVWHYPHYHGSAWTPGASLRRGDWKVIEFYETDSAELYHLGKDPGELNDLSEERPEKLAELRTALRDWQREMNAKMPVEVGAK